MLYELCVCMVILSKTHVSLDMEENFYEKNTANQTSGLKIGNVFSWMCAQVSLTHEETSIFFLVVLL